jgi:NAD(P)-dependent dehydrogenase (short-subunit alcohol dehydrogenase family)
MTTLLKMPTPCVDRPRQARPWTAADVGAQFGRSVVVTGTGGLGYESASALAFAGAHVVLAGRDPAKGEAAVERIRQAVPRAKILFERLDLASLASIHDFAERLGRTMSKLDVLINNAAVMAPPERRTTGDGFELQFGTNHLGHFALTALLMPLLKKAGSARVVSVSSIAARSGALRFDDLQWTHGYKPMPAYAQSKLACLMFALELQRRSVVGGWGVTSVAAHPGVARTDLIPNGTGAASGAAALRRWLWFLFQPAAQGALPSLYAACAPQAEGGGFYGPHALGETRGHPSVSRVPAQALRLEDARRLWAASEGLTGQCFAPTSRGAR